MSSSLRRGSTRTTGPRRNTPGQRISLRMSSSLRRQVSIRTTGPRRNTPGHGYPFIWRHPCEGRGPSAPPLPGETPRAPNLPFACRHPCEGRGPSAVRPVRTIPEPKEKGAAATPRPLHSPAPEEGASAQLGRMMFGVSPPSPPPSWLPPCCCCMRCCCCMYSCPKSIGSIISGGKPPSRTASAKTRRA